MKLDRREIGVCLGVEGVDVLRDDGADESHCSELSDCFMARVRAGSVQVRPSQEAPGPVSFAGFVVTDELVVVDWSVCFVQGVCATGAAIISEARSHGNPGSGEEDRFRFGTRGGKEFGEGMTGACGGVGISGDYDRRWQGSRVGDAHQRFFHVDALQSDVLQESER